MKRSKRRPQHRINQQRVKQLLRGNRRQQREALGLINERLKRPMLATIERCGPDLGKGDAELAYQDMLIAIWDSARNGGCRFKGKVVPYLSQIARNKVTDIIREKQVQPSSLEEITAGVAQALITSCGVDWELIKVDERRESLIELREALSHLPRRERQVAQAFIEGFPESSMQQIQQRIYERSGEPLACGTINAAWQRARKKISEHLPDKFGDDDGMDE